MRVFISGGCKNGKSFYAQRLAMKMRQEGKPLYYIATMSPVDLEDVRRIERHREERLNWGFETVEAPKGVYETITECDAEGAFLLDSVTALLANEMFPSGEAVVEDAYKKVAADLKAVLNEVGSIVLVSDFIYSDAACYNALTEIYRKGLAYIDREMAKMCDAALEVCYGSIIVYKGAKALCGAEK